MQNHILFSGKIICYGVLTPSATISNIEEMIENCPDEFRGELNPYHNFAQYLRVFGGNRKLFENNKLKTKDKKLSDNQIKYFYALYRNINVRENDYIAVLGWMLSEIFEEIPKYPKEQLSTLVNQKRCSSVLPPGVLAVLEWGSHRYKTEQEKTELLKQTMESYIERKSNETPFVRLYGGI